LDVEKDAAYQPAVSPPINNNWPKRFTSKKRETP
jgi:hypothetical protein